ncbi:MAG: hypothetical protein OXN89_04225 [Bryobacterales bacterium]|nr:hypothetical protein [Bryobacterales bacterium]
MQQRLAAELKGLFAAAAEEVIGLAKECEKLDAGLTRDGAELARVNASVLANSCPDRSASARISGKVSPDPQDYKLAGRFLPHLQRHGQ